MSATTKASNTSGGGSSNFDDVMEANLPMSSESNDDTKANILNLLILEHEKRTIHLFMLHGTPGMNDSNQPCLLHHHTTHLR
ncbi:hypothetical protein B9Z55_026524 [Caenorhabditis nigoni]|uniref:Uncharacterized protein n=1 Tax=Caenorhabditis nigoni TaxID=1611254 RepID=A0A2G5T3T2_9PELO|nr:hypothetical protein B9Z55_026524 [Caenorhabditis nigoni]